MVRSADFVVNITALRFPDIGAEDVVDAHPHAMMVVGETGSITAADETVFQQLTYPVVGIGDGRVVEIATENHGKVLFFDIPCKVFHLRSPVDRGEGKLLDDRLRLCLGTVALHLAVNHHPKLVALIHRELRGCQMGIDDNDGVFVHQ